MNTFLSCVIPGGRFVYGIHKPSYFVTNVRKNEKIEPLGKFEDGTFHHNVRNFPVDDVEVKEAHWIYEIPNALPFRGATFIDKEWADACTSDYSRIRIPKNTDFSLSCFLQEKAVLSDIIADLPRPLLLATATCSTDPLDLVRIAHISCAFIHNDDGEISGLAFQDSANGIARPVIYDHALFEAVANNPWLPQKYKIAMVLRPGAQGSSEIVGEWAQDDTTHVFEYLRRNSYIAGGHYASNMANDAIRYTIADLQPGDMTALRHLYYQRSYIRLAQNLGISTKNRQEFSVTDLETLRLQILSHPDISTIDKISTLWGWNFGFDYSPTDYRLHASHQQIHQQYAMVPESVEMFSGNTSEPIGHMQSFSSGDMVAAEIEKYRRCYDSDFFTDYYAAIRHNVRMDDREDLPSSLIVWQDDHVVLFVPKAQTSQWELQLITAPNSSDFFPGNILETDAPCRQSLDNGILKAQKILEELGAKMVTTIEYSKRITAAKNLNQPLMYTFLPKLPQSPGAFSEAQLRFINGHYPEDFAAVCRNALQKT